jgi:hypothetical protein
MDSAAKRERILGQTFTAAQVTERARELERVTAFVWKVKTAMRVHHAAVLNVADQPE